MQFKDVRYHLINVNIDQSKPSEPLLFFFWSSN